MGSCGAQDEESAEEAGPRRNRKRLKKEYGS